MRRLLALGIAALLSGSAVAQTTSSTNTPPGYVWTYLGPTFGADWQSPPPATMPWSLNTGGPNWPALGYGSWNGARFSVNNYPASGEVVLPLDINSNQPTTLMGGMNIPANAVGATHGSGVKGMALTASTQLGAVGTYGFGGQDANGVQSWGMNSVVTNCGTPGCALGSGYNARALWGMEVDVNLMKTPGGNLPGPTQVYGVQIIGASEIGVAPGGLSVGLGVSPLGYSLGIPWQVGIGVSDAAAQQGLAIGSLGATGSVTDSQSACFTAYGPSQVPGCIHVDSGGSFHFDSWHGFNKFDSNHVTIAQIRPGSLDLLSSGSAPNANSATLVLGAVNSAGTTRNDFIQGVANGAGSDLVLASDGGSVVLQSSGTPAVKTTSVVAAGATGMYLLVNNSSGANLVLVTLGAPNTCGAGLRCLAVAN